MSTASINDFTLGIAPQPVVKGLTGVLVTEDDLPFNLDNLKERGLTHYEISVNILLDGTPVYSFTGLQPLEQRLRAHIAANFFP
jgi:hypothetical protein